MTRGGAPTVAVVGAGRREPADVRGARGDGRPHRDLQVQPVAQPPARRGARPGPIDGAIGGVAEGAFTVEAARVLADQLDVDAPIVREVHLALYERKPVRRCLADLLTRETRDEQADAGAWRTALSGH